MIATNNFETIIKGIEMRMKKNELFDTKRIPALSIEWADPKKVRARRVVSRSNCKPTGKYPSWKMKRMMQWESQHECHALMMLDSNPEVLSFSEQPCLIRYSIDGEICRHYPDILVITKQGRELWEIKLKAEADSLAITRRTAYLSKHLPDFGCTYRVIHAESLAVQPQLENIKRLLRQGRQPVELICKERFRILFQHSNAIPWKLLSTKEFDFGRQTARLILEGYLECPFHLPINDDTLITIKSQLGDQS